MKINMEELEARVKKVLSNVFDVPYESISLESSADSIPNWDSLGQLNLILALEEEFNISIPEDEFVNLVNTKLIILTISELI